jgi:hypothetical protein
VIAYSGFDRPVAKTHWTVTSTGPPGDTRCLNSWTAWYGPAKTVRYVPGTSFEFAAPEPP